MRLSKLLDWLAVLNPLLITVAISFLSIEFGFQFGRKRRRLFKDQQEVLVRTMVGAMVSLTAFVLAVTFWIAASHFDGARQARINEANTIRGAYLNADLLPEPHRTELRNLLREYVDIRLRGIGAGRLEEAIVRSEEAQRRLWSAAIKAREMTSSPVIDRYLTGSLNEVMAIHARRVAIYREYNIPTMIWVALYTITMLAMASIGCHAGLTCDSRPPVIPAFVFIFSVVMTMIADLDSPHRGIFTIGHQTMVDLRNMMGAPNS